MINQLLIKILGIAFLASYLIGSTWFGIHMYKAFTRVENNQTVLLEQTKGINKDKQLVLTPAEFKQAMDSSDRAILKHLDIKVKNLEQLVKVSAEGNAHVYTPVKDTIINNNNILMPARAFNYTSKFLDLKGLVFKDTASIIWGSRDSLDVALYWKREGKFLPFIFGKKVYRAGVEGQNPYMKYIVSKNIKIQRE